MGGGRHEYELHALTEIFDILRPTRWMSRQTLPLIATLVVCALLYTSASIYFRDLNFFTSDVFIGFFRDESFLGVAALGTTFVILSGGIDLSVGSMVGCSGIVVATLIERAHIHPFLAMAMVLVGATLVGTVMGSLIHFFQLTPFLVTLGGLFVLRGAALLVSEESVPITHPIYVQLSSMSIPIGFGIELPLTAAIFLALAAALMLVASQTRFGRNAYAAGGNEMSATLMGLPVAATKIGVYSLGCFCGGLAGLVFTLITQSGNAVAGAGMELDAIATAVIGGTLLSGGVGFPAGTVLGVVTFAIIQTSITYLGWNSWDSRIAIGGLLLAFLLIQRLIQSR